jgi:hypothetical protein
MNQGTFVYRYDRNSGREETAKHREGGLSVLETVREGFDHRLHTRVSQRVDEGAWISDTIMRRTIPEAEAGLFHIDHSSKVFRGREPQTSSAVGDRSDFDFFGKSRFTQETREGPGDIAEPQQCDRKERKLAIDDLRLTIGLGVR